MLYCSGCVELSPVLLEDSQLPDGWVENTALRNTGVQFLGLERWQSFTYQNTGGYPASMTITTMKTIVLNDEEQLQQLLRTTIEEVYGVQFQLNVSSFKQGERLLINGQQSRYFLYNASSEYPAWSHVRIIGEVWNCVSSGVSVLCHGYAVVSLNNTTSLHSQHWDELVQDPQQTISSIAGEGIIYTIHCS